MTNAGSTVLRAMRAAPLPLSSDSRGTGFQSMRVAWSASSPFSPGCSRQKSTTSSRYSRIWAHSSTVVGLPASVRSAASSGHGGAPASSGTSSIQPPRSSTSRVFSLFAFQRARESVVIA